MRIQTTMKSAKTVSTMITAAIIAVMANSALGAGNPEKGADVYKQCIACHSLEPKQNRTGPSLDGVFGRKAGTAPGFMRYSDALKNTNVVWNAKSLDAWLKDPREFLPNNLMIFRGISDQKARQDLIAYLKTVDSKRPSTTAKRPATRQGPPLADLKALTPKQQVTAIRHCADGYFVTLGTGNTYPFWEFNLRFKTDTSEYGPPKGKPAILQAGMRGDRASVIFSAPEEISAFIKEEC